MESILDESSISTSSTSNSPSNSVPTIITSTSNKTFSIHSSPISNPVLCYGSKKSLSSHQALLRSGPKVSSASAVGVGAKNSSYGTRGRVVRSSSSKKEKDSELEGDTSGSSSSRVNQSLSGERPTYPRLISWEESTSGIPPIFSPGINSGELDRRLEQTEEHLITKQRPSMNKRNSSSNSSSSRSQDSISVSSSISKSPLLLTRLEAPNMIRSDTEGSGSNGSAASLSPMSEKSFCLSDGGRSNGSCESAFTTPGPSPYRKEFDLDDGVELKEESLVGRSSEPQNQSRSSGSSGETATTTTKNSWKSSSMSISRATSLRSGSSGGSSSFNSYPRHVRRSTFGRDSTTGRWLYSPTSTPSSSRSASTNAAAVFNQGSLDGESSKMVENPDQQVHRFAEPLPQRAPLDLEGENENHKGRWRKSFNWKGPEGVAWQAGAGGGAGEGEGDGDGGEASWKAEDGEISPKKVTFGKESRKEEKLQPQSQKGKAFNQWLGESETRNVGETLLDVSVSRTRSLAEPSLEKPIPVSDQPTRALSTPQTSLELENSKEQDSVEFSEKPPSPPAYLRISAGAMEESETSSNKILYDVLSEGSKEQVDGGTASAPTSIRNRAQSSPNSTQWNTSSTDEFYQPAPPSTISRRSADSSSLPTVEAEVDVYHLPAVAIAARALPVNVAQSSSLPTIAPSESTSSFSSTFPFMAASTSNSKPSNSQQQLLRRRSERDVPGGRGKTTSSLRSGGSRSGMFSSFPTEVSFLEDVIITEEPSTMKAVTPPRNPRARAVSASSATSVDNLSGTSSASPKLLNSGSPIPPSPRGKFTQKFKGGNLDLGIRKRVKEKKERVVDDEEVGEISIPKDVEADTPMESLGKEIGITRKSQESKETANLSDQAVSQSFGQLTFSAFQVTPEQTPRPSGISDFKDPFEAELKEVMSSPSRSTFKSDSSTSSETARHISARTLASRLLIGDSTNRKGGLRASNNLLANSNARFAKAISAVHHSETDGEDSDGYSSETPVPTPNGLTPMPNKNPIEVALHSNLAITPPLESSSANSTPPRSTLSFQPQPLEEESKMIIQRKRGSYPFGMTKPSDLNPPSPLELPELLLESIPSSKSEDWLVKSKECLAVLEMDSKSQEWGNEKLNALEKGWKRRTIAGVMGLRSSSSTLQVEIDSGSKVESRSFSTPSSIFIATAKKEAEEKSLLEGATEARTQNRHKTWAPERFGEELGKVARGGGREFSREEARVAMNSGKVLEAVKEDSRETSFEAPEKSEAPISVILQARPARPPKNPLRMVTSPQGVESLLASVSMGQSGQCSQVLTQSCNQKDGKDQRTPTKRRNRASTGMSALNAELAEAASSAPVPPSLRKPFEKAAAASKASRRTSMPAQQLISTPILTAPIPRSACRPSFIHSDSQQSQTPTSSPLPSFLKEFQDQDLKELESELSQVPILEKGPTASILFSNERERRHSRIPSLLETRKNSFDILSTSFSLSQSLNSCSINPLVSPLAQAAVSNLNTPSSNSFSPHQSRPSFIFASPKFGEEGLELEPYRVTPRPEGDIRGGAIGINGVISPR